MWTHIFACFIKNFISQNNHLAVGRSIPVALLVFSKFGSKAKAQLPHNNKVKTIENLFINFPPYFA
ncbi:hypothetical protein B10263_03940 [Campylobacter jejuni]|nr:hypothetical protein B10091_08400 [Campylobacter jejuni]BEJ76984.1 hypothetical protein B10335_08260 [Campylobacter jejuni]BEJ94681.1 hypothetical protein B10579_08240 [Campylobacter jejuni]BEJ96428.1 hypothetical protein B10605_08260 [Campylobacter jejuni]BEJ99903.1 hypothetical protein B10617_08400 [Campylobacter jejuni]